jgi:hypothetical protein
LLHLDDVEISVLKAAGNIFRWRVWGKVWNTAFVSFSDLGEKVK